MTLIDRVEEEGNTLAGIRKLIRERTGFDLGLDKNYLIEGRLASMLSAYGCESYDSLAHTIDSDPLAYSDFVERITTHETLFFRDESLYTALAAQIIPEWLNRSQTGRLSIWSAGCSTGQEPYSILMILQKAFPQVFERTDMRGTDISSVTIARAKQGIFTSHAIGRGLSEDFLSRFFRVTDTQYQVNAELRAKVDFEVHNLQDLPYRGQYDIIFCRNVLIYFDHPLRRLVLEGFRKCLKPNGVLVLGSAESVQGYVDNYIIRECGLARYYEFNAPNVTIFPRSAG
ncbi:MAG: protein-glutamate O-methyltransferase CheR [Spirochaetia bacterium]|nr:protein-glutamate O-methyltransferase CheR [Spirochaetia bacterium]